MKSIKKNLVTISIPTLNSELFLGLCFTAIKKQTYSPIEINIIDGGSHDKTIQIAKDYGAVIIEHKGSLMSARYEGVKKARGIYTLLLDSDQILEKDAIARAVIMMEKDKLDMLVFEEDVYRNKTFLEHLFHLDRKLVHSARDLNPYTSVLLPRFFKTDLLKKIYEKIPKNIINHTTPQDHAILYLEFWKISKKISLLPIAVKHIEPSSIPSLFKKFFRWGYFSIETKSSEYDDYFKKRTERFRKGMFKKSMVKESAASILLLLIKGIPYKTGYVIGKLNKKLHKK